MNVQFAFSSPSGARGDSAGNAAPLNFCPGLGENFVRDRVREPEAHERSVHVRFTLPWACAAPFANGNSSGSVRERSVHERSPAPPAGCPLFVNAALRERSVRVQFGS